MNRHHLIMLPIPELNEEAPGHSADKVAGLNICRSARVFDRVTCAANDDQNSMKAKADRACVEDELQKVLGEGVRFSNMTNSSLPHRRAARDETSRDS